MAVANVCNPLLALSDAKNDTFSTPNVALMTDAEKVINTKLDSTQVEGDREEELLKGLLTDDYCHVCEAVLLFKSQRLSHYEGKKHAQKLRVYLRAKRDEKMNKESTWLQQTMTTDKDRFCELCNMVFSSPVVARSHYKGKVHAKNLGKKGLQPSDLYKEGSTSPSQTGKPDDADQNSTADGDIEHNLDPTAPKTTPSTEFDLKDPSKYCALCAALFNNPQMALQHYNGRKHQRNQARQDLLMKLGDNVQQANSLMCQMCSVQFNSVEMYQAHMQGSKHQIREKKVIDLCKSQQKSHSTFTDELSDYIQVQRARGIAPKTTQVLPTGDRQKQDEDEENEDEVNKGDFLDLSKRMPNLSHTSNPPHHSRPGCYNPDEGWGPPYQGPPLPSNGWYYNRPPSVFPGSRSETCSSRPIKRRRLRNQSSSSSYNSSSSYSSSYSSSASDSDNSEYRRREKRTTQRSRRERDKRVKEEDPDKVEKRRKRQRKDRGNESEKRRKEESGDSEEEGRRKKLKGHGKRGRQEKESQGEDLRLEEGKKVVDRLMPEHMTDNDKERDVHIKTDMNVEQGDGGEDEPVKPKYRKEKKKTKERPDNRTEDEKLWDDSILGC